MKPFQSRVHDWIIACFGEEIGADKQERNHRFIEEALELVQANGCTKSEAHQLVDYVYGRPVGDPHQEVGGVMNTLAALCTASGIDMDRAGEDELARVWTKVEKIRAKQAAKPKHSPLPQTAPDPRIEGWSAAIEAAAEKADEVRQLLSIAQGDAFQAGHDTKGYRLHCAQEAVLSIVQAIRAIPCPYTPKEGKDDEN